MTPTTPSTPGGPTDRPPLRVGTVPYLVARPLDAGLGDEPGVELCPDVPARLVERLRAGELDVALVSSIELFRRPGYGYLDGVAVAGEGGVSSVCVFLRKPLTEVRSVALDPASRTAATLTQVVWPREAGPRPAFVELDPGVDPRTATTDAWLRIGDEALREALDPARPEVFLPSAAFAAATGLPFVFAVWVVRPGVDPGPHLDAFARARARGAARVPALAREAAAAWSIPEEAALDYLAGEILYEPGERLGPSLTAFRDGAAPLGLCRGDLAPRPVGRVGPVDPVDLGGAPGVPSEETACPES